MRVKIAKKKVLKVLWWSKINKSKLKFHTITLPRVSQMQEWQVSSKFKI